MLRILICDDDQAQLNYLRDRIRTLCDQNSTAAIIHSFDDAGSIPQQLLRDHDIAFLDIDFREKGYNGIHIAKELRQANQDSVIIFVTNYIEYAPEGYEVQAFRYLLKSETDSKLERYLLDAVTKSQEQQEKITFTISGEPITIALRDILYIEAQAHNAVIHICAKKDSSSDQERAHQHGHRYALYSYLNSCSCHSYLADPGNPCHDHRCAACGHLRFLLQCRKFKNGRSCRKFQQSGVRNDDRHGPYRDLLP